MTSPPVRIAGLGDRAGAVAVAAVVLAAGLGDVHGAQRTDGVLAQAGNRDTFVMNGAETIREHSARCQATRHVRDASDVQPKRQVVVAPVRATPVLAALPQSLVVRTLPPPAPALLDE